MRYIEKFHRNYVDKLDIYRIHDWWYYLGFVILGSLLGKDIQPIQLSTLLVSSFALSFIYALNDFADQERKKKFFVFPLLLLIGTIGFLNLRQIIALSLFLIFQIIYSVNPFRLKRFPLVGTFCCSLGFPQFFVVGYLEGNKLDLEGFLLFLFLVILSTVIQLIHEVTDFKKDALQGLKTTAVYYGQEKIKNICLVFICLGFLISIILYFLEVIETLVFIALIVFHIYIGIQILIYGITDLIRVKFRITALITGAFWAGFLIFNLRF